MSTEPPPLTVFEVARRAVQLIDPDDNDPTAGDFERAFEDDDEPVRGVDDIEGRVADVLARLDPATNNGALSMAGALTVYLAYRRDEVHADPAKLLVLAARAEWDGDPPEAVVEWLADRGLEV
ncbi:MAG TPA: hypothetical protein VKV21_00750 [Solirubrobacteraceae bacterium]|nr:hypothetical protein [Solirubrobacteraceae bacterium]